MVSAPEGTAGARKREGVRADGFALPAAVSLLCGWPKAQHSILDSDSQQTVDGGADFALEWAGLGGDVDRHVPWLSTGPDAAPS